MINFSAPTLLLSRWYHRYRLPFRNDTLFSLLMLTTVTVTSAFSLFTYESFEVIKFLFLLFFVGLCLIVFLWQKKPVWRFSKSFTLILGGFWGWSVLATIFSLDRYNSIFGRLPRLTGSLIFFTALGLLALLLINSLNREKFIFLVKVLNLLSLAIALLSLLQTLGIANYEGLEAPSLLRAPSLIGNPNFSSMFLATVLPLTVMLWAMGKSIRSRIFYASSTLIISWAIAAMSSRGALLAVVISIISAAVLIVWFKLPKRYLGYLITSLVATVILFLLFFFNGRPDATATTLNLSEINVTSRVAVWDLALKVMRDHPWFGSGLANFQIVFEQYRPQTGILFDSLFDDAHNLFLQIGATGGIPLLAWFILLIFVPLMQGLKRLRSNEDWVVLGTLAGLVAFLVSASFTPVPSPCYLLLFVLLAGLAFPSVKTVTLQRLVSWCRAAAVVMGGLFMVYGVSFYASQVIFFNAYKNYLRSNLVKSEKLIHWSIRLNPFYDFYYLHLASYEAEMGYEPSQVLQILQRFQSFHPLEGKSHRQAAAIYLSLYRKTGNMQFANKAITETQRASQIDPYLSEPYQYLSLITFETGRYDESLGYLYKSPSYQSWILMAKIYQIKNMRQQAIFALTKAQSIQPSNQLWNILETAKKESDIQKAPLPVVLHDEHNLN